MTVMRVGLEKDRYRLSTQEVTRPGSDKASCGLDLLVLHGRPLSLVENGRRLCILIHLDARTNV